MGPIQQRESVIRRVPCHALTKTTNGYFLFVLAHPSTTQHATRCIWFGVVKITISAKSQQSQFILTQLFFVLSTPKKIAQYIHTVCWLINTVITFGTDTKAVVVINPKLSLSPWARTYFACRSVGAQPVRKSEKKKRKRRVKETMLLALVAWNQQSLRRFMSMLTRFSNFNYRPIQHWFAGCCRGARDDAIIAVLVTKYFFPFNFLSHQNFYTHINL